MTPEGRINRLLGGEVLAPLRHRLRQRFERARAGPEPSGFRLDGLSAEDHAALASLLGRAQRPAKSLYVDLARIDANLRGAGLAGSLREALERLDGPITHLPTVRHEAEALWSTVRLGCEHPELAALLGTPSGRAQLKRGSGGNASVAARLIGEAEKVLRRLPAGGVARAQLAAEALGDAHALDAGRAVASLVLAVWRRLSPSALDHEVHPNQGGEAARLARRQERIRDVWARAGVLVNELARPALYLNLPTRNVSDGVGVTGEPAYASLRRLLRSPPAWEVAGRRVHVCENPNLVAIAADHLGASCAPLVCTDGMPAAAQRRLLSRLADAGAQLAYHGDFDWPGVRIGNHVLREFGAQPWRFCARDYEAAVGATRASPFLLKGDPVEACWDEQLTRTMQDLKVSISEEALVTMLLQDLKEV